VRLKKDQKTICVLDLQQMAMFGLADALVAFISVPSHCNAFLSEDLRFILEFRWK
jgi:hypothetical protein